MSHKPERRMTRLGGLAVAALWASTGCTTLAINAMVPTLEDIAAVGMGRPDPEFMAVALPPNLLQLQGMLTLSPKNADLMMLNAEGLCGYALGFVEDDDPVRAGGYYMEGRELALAALERYSRGYRKARERGEPIRDAVQHAKGPDALRAMFWAGNCWGSWLNLNMANPRAYFAIPDVTALMERVLELDPDYYHGGAAIFFGSFYAAAPPIAGGGLTKAWPYFEQAFAASDRKFLMVHYMVARSYATMLKDQEDELTGKTGDQLFDEMLAEIAAADPRAIPELGLANAIIQEKARKLAEQRRRWF